MEVSRIQANDFVSKDIVLWIGQRGLNPQWVAELKRQQYSYISTCGGLPIIPGSLIIIEYNGVSYLIDGQHRRQLLIEMLKEGVNLANTYVAVETYLCTTEQQAVAIYNMVNSRYGSNGITIDDSVESIITYLKQQCPKQIVNDKSYAPYLNPVALEKEIKDSDVMRYCTAEEVINAIIETNTEYGNKLLIANPTQHAKAKSLGSLFLVYKGTNARWFVSIANELKRKGK